jgi:hypothetical protein
LQSSHFCRPTAAASALGFTADRYVAAEKKAPPSNGKKGQRRSLGVVAAFSQTSRNPGHPLGAQWTNIAGVRVATDVATARTATPHRGFGTLRRNAYAYGQDRQNRNVPEHSDYTVHDTHLHFNLSLSPWLPLRHSQVYATTHERPHLQYTALQHIEHSPTFSSQARRQPLLLSGQIVRQPTRGARARYYQQG